MMKASNKEILLRSDAAKGLYRRIEHLPIIELRCALDLDQIASNAPISNISELWLYCDRDRQDIMRACGVEERYISGNASDFEKFKEFCRIMPMLIGNPHYVACQLELFEFFDCELTICSENCEIIWSKVADTLAERRVGALDYLKMTEAEVIFAECTPETSLEPYDAIRQHCSKIRILPLFNGDGCFDIGGREFAKYIAQVAKRAKLEIVDLDSFCRAMSAVMDSFAAAGCISAYHKITPDYLFSRPDEYHAELVLKKALSGKWADITREEIAIWKTQLLRFLGIECERLGWVLQINADAASCVEVEKAMRYMSSSGALPRVLMHSDSALDLAVMAETCKSLRRTLAGASPMVIQCVGVTGSDTRRLEQLLELLASQTALGCVVGASGGYCGFRTRQMQEIFRKSLCNVVGEWIDLGICKEDIGADMITRISYGNLAQLLDLRYL